MSFTFAPNVLDLEVEITVVAHTSTKLSFQTACVGVHMDRVMSKRISVVSLMHCRGLFVRSPKLLTCYFCNTGQKLSVAVLLSHRKRQLYENECEEKNMSIQFHRPYMCWKDCSKRLR